MPMMGCILLLLSVLSLSLGGGRMEASPLCDGPDHEYKYTVKVDPSAANKDCHRQSLTGVATCPDINTALAEYSHRSSTAFVLVSGPNMTHVLKPGADSFLRELTDVGFFGESSSNLARVECKDGAGLAFWNVDQIQLQNVEFSLCGALRNTTSVLTRNIDTRVKAGLYFYNGTDVTMCHVTVQHGPESLGVLMYDTDGTVNIYYSNFVNNTGPDDGMNTYTSGGGGFYIEFTYCVPAAKDEECSKQLTHIANSSYVFQNCTFVNNLATTKNVARFVTRDNHHIGFGRGGGLALFFNNNATGNTFRILGCSFKSNEAFLGGAVYISFKNTSIGNAIIFDTILFDNNMCNTKLGIGGAIRIYSALSFCCNSQDFEGNIVRVTASIFSENQALQGGAIAFSPTYQTTRLSIANSSFSANRAQLGSAIHVERNPFFIFGTVNDVAITDCIFKRNSYHKDSSHDMGIGIVYTSQVPLNFSSSVKFCDNDGSALAVTGTYASFYNTNATFLSNKGDTGGAIALLGSAYAMVNQNTSMYFRNNVARKGSAIYNLIAGQVAVKISRACFIVYSDPFEERNKWKASFTFENNTSHDSASNSIYTTSAYPCARVNTNYKKNLSETVLFCNNSNWMFVNSRCSDEIRTQGNSYNFSNESAVSSIPGKGFILPVLVHDDLGHNITNSTGYTSMVSPINESSTTDAQVDPRYSLTSDNYLSIVGQENTTVKLKLQSTGYRPHYLELEVKVLQCPPGLHFEPTAPDGLKRCTCNSALSFGNTLNCSTDNFEASIPRISWIGPDPTGLRKGELVMGEVPDLYSKQESNTVLFDYYLLPKSYGDLDREVCGSKDRTGPLCGKCIANYSTSVNTYNYVCTRCDDSTNIVKNVFVFMAFAYLPYILLLSAVAFFNLKLTSSATNGFILFAQMTSLDIFDLNGNSRFTSQTSLARMSQAFKFVYGIFDFHSFANFMNPFCVHKNWTTLDVLCLEYTLAGLPILLILLLFLVLRFKRFRFQCCKSKRLSIRSFSRRSSRRKRIKEGSLIHILVACILLSYTKITVVSMKMLSIQILFDRKRYSLFGDPRVHFAGHLSFFSTKYLLPYGVLAMLMVLIFVLIPPLFLLGVPQLIDRILDTGKFPRLKRLWPTVNINIFLDAFQGFYKPQLYCRIFAGLYFVFRLVIVILYVATSNYLISYSWKQFFIVLMILLLAIFQPYKKRIYNVLDIFIFFNLACINTISFYVYTSSLTVRDNVSVGVFILQYILIWLPLVYMLSYVGYKILAKLGIAQKCRRRRQEPIVYFNTSASESQQSAHSKSEDEWDYWDSDDMLSDSALFSRAKSANKFRPPRRKSQNPTRTMVDVSQQLEEDPQSGDQSGDFESEAQSGDFESEAQSGDFESGGRPISHANKNSQKFPKTF